MKTNIVLIFLLITSGALLFKNLKTVESIRLNETQSNNNVSKQLAGIYQRLSSMESKLNSGLSTLDSIKAIAEQPPSAPQPPQKDPNKVNDIPIGASPILGDKNAPVTITEFSDFQCPFCARFHPPVLEVLKAYPDKVKLVIKNYPLDFHPNARPAAKLALAAHEQGKYFEMVQELLNNEAATTDDKVKEYAKKLGLDYKKLADDFKSKDAQWEKTITDDQNLAGQVGVQGTPTFFINGRETSARDLNGYKTEIEKILKAN